MLFSLQAIFFRYNIAGQHRYMSVGRNTRYIYSADSGSLSFDASFNASEQSVAAPATIWCRRMCSEGSHRSISLTRSNRALLMGRQCQLSRQQTGIRQYEILGEVVIAR